MHPRDVLVRYAEPGQRRDVRPRVARVAEHPDPPALAGEQVAQHGAELGAVVVGHHHVGGAVQIAGRAGDDLEAGRSHGRGAAGVGLQEDPAEPEIRGVAQQVAGYGGGEHGDQGAVGGRGRRLAVRDGAGRVRLG